MVHILKSQKSPMFRAILIAIAISILSYIIATSTHVSAAPPSGGGTTIPTRAPHYLNKNYKGTKKIAVIVFETKNYKNPIRTNDVMPLLTGPSDSAQSYYSRVSNNTLNLTTDSKSIYGGNKPYLLSRELDLACSNESPNSLLDEAYSKAKADGLDGGTAKADMVIYIGPNNPSCPSLGTVTDVPGQTNKLGFGYGDIYISGPVGMKPFVLLHEMGHSFNFGHAGTYNCYDSNGKKVAWSYVSGNCELGEVIDNGRIINYYEYGDTMDIMGKLNILREPTYMVDPSGFRKTSAGWGQTQKETGIGEGGTYTVINSESLMSQFAGYHTVRVPMQSPTDTKPPTSWYEFEQRGSSGLLIKVQSFGPNGEVVTHKLDVTPNYNEKISGSGLRLDRYYTMVYYDSVMKMLVTPTIQDDNHTTFTIKYNADPPAGTTGSGSSYQNLQDPYGSANNNLTIKYEVYLDDPATPGPKDSLLTTPFGFSPIRVSFEGSFEGLKGSYGGPYCTPSLNPGHTGYDVLNATPQGPYDAYTVMNWLPLSNSGTATLTGCPFQKGLRPASPNASAYYLGQRASIDGYGDNYDLLNADGSVNYYGIDPYIDLHDNAPSTQTFQFFLRKK